MRIALLHYTSHPVTGGVEAIVARHAELLRARGHDVRVVTGRGDGVRIRELDSRDQDVEAVAEALAAGDPVPVQFDRLSERIGTELRPELADRDVVVAHNVLTMPFNLPLAAALGACGRPLVAWTHDVAWSNPRYRAWQRDGQPYDMLRTAVPGARYVAVSGVRADELAAVTGIPRAGIEVVPNGIDADAFAGIGDHALGLLRAAGVRGAWPLLLVPQRVTRRKRLELVIEAAGELRRDFPELAVVVTGPLGPHAGDNHDYWLDLAQRRRQIGLEDRVVFLHELGASEGRHPVDDADVAQLYRAADAVVVPSESEGFGLPVLEAGVVRVPLVCADLPVLLESGGDQLFTFPAAGGAGDLAAAVRQALAQPAAVLRRRVLEEYSWTRLVPRIEAALEAARA